jgi:hypothetical protein
MPPRFSKVRGTAPKLPRANIKRGTETLVDLDIQQPRASTASAASVDDAIAAVTAATPQRRAPTEAERHEAAMASGAVFGSWAEWQSVLSAIFGCGPTAKALPLGDVDDAARDAALAGALESVRRWRGAFRGFGRNVFPRYVDATALLVQAQRLDRHWIAETAAAEASGAASPSVVTFDVVVHGYAAAISRAVHELTEAGAAANAATYRERAREMLMPEELVEVRNFVAHGAVPALAQLRWAAALGLRFLFADYWALQARQLGDLAAADRHESSKASRKEHRRLSFSVDAAVKGIDDEQRKRRRTEAVDDAAPRLSLAQMRERLSTAGSEAPVAAVVAPTTWC